MKLAKKTLASIICLLIIVCINFFLPRIIPGDPVLMLTGQDTAALSPQQIQQHMEKLGLDKPLSHQFKVYLIGLLKGDLGYSYHYSENVGTLLAKRIPVTLQLAIPTVIISTLLAVILGSWAGYHNGSGFDKTVTNLMLGVNAIPVFLMAMILVSIFSFKLDIFPLGGMNSIVPPTGAVDFLLDRIYHLALPVLTLSLVSVPEKYLVIRNSVAAASREKYVTYAQTKGISKSRIIFVHILSNISDTVVAMLGMNLAFIVSGSLISEVIFSINGMGSLMYEAVSFRDYPALQGCLLATGLAVLIASITTDLFCFIMGKGQNVDTE